MKKNIRSRTIFIAAVTLAALYVIFLPHDRRLALADFTDSKQISENVAKNIRLGLDLKGGIHLVMQVQAEEAVQAHVTVNAETVSKVLPEKGIEIAGDPVVDTTAYTVTVKVADAAKAQEAAEELKKDFNGTTLTQAPWSASVNGDTITMTMSGGEAQEIRQTAHQQAMTIINNRIDQFGVAEHVLQRHGAPTDYQILLQLPGVDDPERVKKLLQAESNLELRAMVGQAFYPTREAAMAAVGDPSKNEVLPVLERDEEEVGDEKAGDSKAPKEAPGAAAPVQYAVIEKEPIVRGVDLRDAVATPSQFGGKEWEINFTLKQNAASKFGEWTGSHIGTNLAIVLNGQVKSAPVIQGRIDDRGQITGRFTQRSSEDLALTLRSGALPARIVYQEERTVGPSLGADSIRQGLLSSVLGLSSVCLFLLFYYRGSGVNAIVALVLNLLLLMAGLAAFNATLTLPGIAGIILTIGMAVDSNVLIFERIREELRNGKVVRSAVDTGFGKAFTTIMDTHVTTIVSAVFLLVFGTGPIRGYAVSLIIGLLANLFTAIFVSRTIFTWIVHRGPRPAESLSI
jgi:preprotein translocase subunit SecD